MQSRWCAESLAAFCCAAGQQVLKTSTYHDTARIRLQHKQASSSTAPLLPVPAGMCCLCEQNALSHSACRHVCKQH
jgi:hypothetical protein